MEPYKLTLRDKIYLFFQDDTIKRKEYLFPKVEEQQFNYFNNNGIHIPVNFDRYISNYVDCLIFEYDLRK